ncbi:MAG: type I-E CRISPR-associated protein Cse2/CasB [Streptococcus sp.]|nr:type I-E CRISPR-associated protein Cse2/CasB [Streptococcus sp.]
MTRGQQAELRRATEPNDLTLKPALYRLLPGIQPGKQYLRIAFLIPWFAHQPNAANFGAQCAKADINEARLFQVVRSDEFLGMIQLRRLAVQIKPQVDWSQFGQGIWYWGSRSKRELIETYYLAQYSAKGTLA